MQIKVIRDKFTSESTIGKIYINGEFQGYTLEDCVREVAGQPVEKWKIQNKTAIPAGTYQVTINESAHFGRLMPEILSVPGFTGVRIHSGNTAGDTDGCILVGRNLGPHDAIIDSRPCFEIIFNEILNAKNSKEQIEIIVG